MCSVWNRVVYGQNLIDNSTPFGKFKARGVKWRKYGNGARVGTEVILYAMLKFCVQSEGLSRELSALNNILHFSDTARCELHPCFIYSIAVTYSIFVQPFTFPDTHVILTSMTIILVHSK